MENVKHALLGASSTLSPQLKEEVRRTLAQQTGCRFCASLGLPAEDHQGRRESFRGVRRRGCPRHDVRFDPHGHMVLINLTGVL